MTGLASDFEQRYGPWALVCGASDGIGEGFSRQIAAAGVNVVMIARREPLLVDLAARISKEHGVETRPLVADLTSPDLMRVVGAATADLEIGLLVYVTGSSLEHHAFVDADLSFWIDQIRLNCDAPVALGHHFAAAMRQRGRGGLMFLTSLACQAGASRNSIYAGTKAFDQIFAESLWHELAPHGVDVLSLMVGATNTPTTNDILDLDLAALFPDPSLVTEPDEVARDGLENLANGPVWVAGELLRAGFSRLAPAVRAAAIEAASASTAMLDRFDDYTPVWDIENGKKIAR